MPDPTPRHEGLREAILRRRSERPPAEREAAAAGLRDVFLQLPWLRRLRCVALYEPEHDGAPDTRLLRVALAERGVVVLVLSREEPGRLQWALDLTELREVPVDPTANDSALGSGAAGDRGVVATLVRPRHSTMLSPAAAADVVVVPALAVDTLGHRLSVVDDDFGPFVGALPHATPALAAVYDDEVLDAALGRLPGSADIGLLGALTPTRLLRLGSDRRHSYLAADS